MGLVIYLLASNTIVATAAAAVHLDVPLMEQRHGITAVCGVEDVPVMLEAGDAVVQVLDTRPSHAYELAEQFLTQRVHLAAVSGVIVPWKTLTPEGDEFDPAPDEGDIDALVEWLLS